MGVHAPPDGVVLPVELCADLANARVARARDYPKSTAVVDVAARVIELRVVENVEEFDTNIKRNRFPDLRPLQEPKIGVVEARTMEESAVRSTESSKSGVGSKCPR